MTDSTIPRRELRLAETVARQLINAFIRRKLTPAFSDFLVTHLAGVTMLIAVIDTAKLGDHSPYTNPDLLHQLSTEFGDQLKRRRGHSLKSGFPPHRERFRLSERGLGRGSTL